MFIILMECFIIEKTNFKLRWDHIINFITNFKFSLELSIHFNHIHYIDYNFIYLFPLFH